MKQVTIVGAGLSGLTAAITLAREGWEVDIIERRDGVGGPARDMETGEMTYVMVDGTPMELDKLTRYLGFDISPATIPMDRTTIYCFGKRYDVKFPRNVPAVLVERGMRKDSLDVLLYELAKEAGVKFTFNTPVKTRQDFADLPPDTILATGLFKDTYEAIGIPYVQVYGHMAFGTMENYGGPPVVVYMDRYTQDYAFFSTINGMGGALLFQRGKPLSQESKRWFRKQLAHDEGIEFLEWLDLEVGVLPMGAINNPRLFHDRYILTGTLAGMQDPVLLFGVHGALISGKIAALALTDREAALKQFKLMNALWQLSYINRKIVEKTHPWGLHYAGRAGLDLQPFYEKWLLRYVFTFVPGWLRV
jgi:flavin-dependent dehydrogenase